MLRESCRYALFAFLIQDHTFVSLVLLLGQLLGILCFMTLASIVVMKCLFLHPQCELLPLEQEYFTALFTFQYSHPGNTSCQIICPTTDIARLLPYTAISCYSCN